MATPSDARAVKSLNKSPGGRRFVFKTVSERIEEIEIDVYRSLDKIKSEPSKGSSFLRDCLIEWRELNTAEDFISFYEEMMPFVQTLPLVLLHKESIFSELCSRLQMKARLSLEPILRLIAALSRDLLEDFIPFLPRVANSLVSLLKSGGDREPEIIEQIFTSWSYILMYLQKYLVRNILYTLKVTIKLRYYEKGYVQEFMAAATSFLLRNAPQEQLRKGIRKIMFEVLRKPLPDRKSGVSSLLYHVMKGTSSRFHSRAEGILWLLTDNSTLTIGDRFDQGLVTVVEVVTTTFRRLCEELEPKEINLILNCLYQRIDDCLNNHYLHLICLLSLLISTVQFNSGHKISDYQPLLECVGSLVQKFVVSSSIYDGENHLSDLINKILLLMLCILDGLSNVSDMSAISQCSLQWAPVFELRNSSCLTFIGELLEKDLRIFYEFRANALSAMNGLIETSPDEVVCLLLSLCERQQKDPLSFGLLDGVSEGKISNIHNFLQGAVRSWVVGIHDIILGKVSSSMLIDEAKLALLWGIICCYPHTMDIQKAPLLMDLVDALDQLLSTKTENIQGAPEHAWESLIGAALNSYLKYGRNTEFQGTSKIVHLAIKYKRSPQVLSAVADYLDYVHGLEGGTNHTLYHPEFEAKSLVDALSTFADNLFNSDKTIRVSTLRILFHFGTQCCELSGENQLPEKKMTVEASQTHSVCNNGIDALQLLLLVESTPLSVSTSRKVILLISRIQMGIAAGRISETYIPIVMSGVIGIFHNRFSYIWNPASECLATLIREHTVLVWENLVHYFEQCLSAFLVSSDKARGGNVAEFSVKCNDLVEHFNCFVASASDSTPYATVLSSMLQSLQKVPFIAESHSRHIVPLFFKFMGCSSDLLSVESFTLDACKGKEWKGVLKEWLDLFKLVRNPKAFYRSQFLKDVLQFRLIDENDAEIQMKVLDCLLTWKDDFLIPYEQHLRNLISSKYLREELTTWSLSRESCLIEEDHRANLLSLVIRLLIPKVRTLKTLASRKHASISHRKAVLRFIAQLELKEIVLFFVLLTKPLHILHKEFDGTKDLCWTLPEGLLDESVVPNSLRGFATEKVVALSWKKKYGFLHVVEDILGVFDESHVRPFLSLLMGCVVWILGSCTSSLHAVKNAGSSVVKTGSDASVELYREDSLVVAENLAVACTSVRQLKDLRSLCLKIVSLVLNKYDDHDFGCEFWDMFFSSVKPLVDSFKQEGSSSEKPSSLFSCFLSMSRSHHLVPLLNREKNLVSDIFSILTIKTASEAIVSCVFKFIENLLNLDEELDDDDNVIKGILMSNLDELVRSLHCLFQTDNPMKRKLAKCPGETHLRIFKLLLKYIRDELLARKFVDILLPLLSKRTKNSDLFVECLQVIRDIIPVVGMGSTTKILNAVSPLLLSAELDLRLCICDLLDALAKTDPSVIFVANILRELNATSAAEIGGLDYDTIINAYEKIGVGFFHTAKEDHVLVILSNCIYDMSSEELILRNSAYRTLLSFVEFSALILGGEDQNHGEVHELMATNSERSWTTASIQQMVKKFLLKHLGNAMKRGSSVGKEWIELLRDIALKLPGVANLGSFRALCSEDAEQDFFNNIIHLQKHRRARAVTRFRNVFSKSNMPEGLTNKLFVPLFFNMLLDVQDGKGEHVRNACVEALSSISAHMEWKSYYALLISCFQEMNLNLNKQKVLLQLVCSILDQFHFSEICSVQGDKEGKYGSSVVVTDMQACLQKTILPKIQKLLNSDSDKVNVNINVAALKLLKLLPGDIMDSQLPSIIHHIANNLKSRLESIRDEARRALAACLKELGLEFLQFIVRVLRATLKRGYELHVLGYSLNFILSKFLSEPINGKLDYCLEDLLSVVETDILGDVAEEKEVEKIASKMKETKKRKSFETLKLIAQSVTFKSHALKLLSPITAQIQKYVTPKMKTKLESMLNYIAAGIQCNPSIDHTDLFIFVYGLIEDGIKEENGQDENSSSSQMTRCQRHDGSGQKAVRVVGTRSLSSHLITVFALGLLYTRIKNMKLDKNSEQHLSMLDPFVKLLGCCLSSKYEDILSASLRCLTPLVRLPLPSLAAQADNIKVTLLDVAQTCANANGPLMQSCLRLLTVLLQSTRITLSSDQLHLLIQFPLFTDLEKNPSFVALSLLRAIIKRKLVVHEVYDLALRVAELMVTSNEAPICKKCSQILLQFLLDYHLSGKYLQQLLDFLLKNLSYEGQIGREAVLEMLHAIIRKFPKSFSDKHANLLFIYLVHCLANDSDNIVRLRTGALIKFLIEHISPHLRDSFLDFSLSWYMNDNRQLQSPGAQALGLLVEVSNYQKHMGSILMVTRNILQSALNAATSNAPQHPSDEMVPFWKEAYYSLVMMEKILHHFHDLVFDRELKDIWEAICELLLHPHTWLRSISSRLVAFYFSMTVMAKTENHRPLGTFYLMRPCKLLMIAVSHCCQLKTQVIDEASSNLITQNLIFTICSMHSLVGGTECMDANKYWSTLEQREQGQLIKAFQSLDARRGRAMFSYIITGAHEQDDREHSENVTYLLISNLLKEMGKIALEMDGIQMKIVFNCFGTMSLQMNQDDCQHYGFQMLLPLYKVCEEFSGKVVPG
uniref:Uncharacterized protein n=1 Tax=Rhizophora mucronata TaxID=61149 RepID=A0A2P2MF27_RHIMU